MGSFEVDRWFVWSIVAVVVGLGGLSAYMYISSLNESSSQVEPVSLGQCPAGRDVSSTGCAIPTGKGTIRYTDREYGFSFQFPDSYKITKQFDNGQELDLSLVGGVGIASRTTTVSVFTRSLADVKATEVSPDSPNLKETNLTLGSHKVDLTTYASDAGGTNGVYLFTLNSYTVAFVTQGKSAAAEAMIASLN